MIQYGCKIEEEVNAMQSEIRKNVQGTNSEGKQTGTQINDLEQNEEIRVQNTGFQDAQGTHWVVQQHKKDPGRNEG